MRLNKTSYDHYRLTMPFHVIEGKQLFYQIQGHGLSLVLIHSSMQSHHQWQYQDSLAEECQLVLLDLPGHGQSEQLDSEISIKRLANIIAQLIQELDMDSFIPVGHSIGGAISLQLALDYSELLEGLILVGTGAKMGVFPAILEGIRSHYYESIELTIGQLWFGSTADPELIEFVKQACFHCNPEVAYADFNACNNFDVRQLLDQIQIPTLVIVGDEDQLTPLKWSQFLADRISNTELVIIENAGHMVMLEQPEQFNNAIKSFLQKL
ncbi:MAG: alpha/beta fold hydrolase [Promethearchaeota archaeon]